MLLGFVLNVSEMCVVSYDTVRKVFVQCGECVRTTTACFTSGTTGCISIIFCTIGSCAPQIFRANLILFRILTLKICEHFPQKQIFPYKILVHHMKCHLSKNCNFVSEHFYIGCTFNKITSEILGSHSSEYEAHSLQGYKVIFNKKAYYYLIF
jgi:hypothetical protein